MHERIAEYESMLTAKGLKGISGYVLAARESATYFDGRGIDMPNADDWNLFAVYIAQKIEQEKGKRPSEDTVRVNYVTRGKAFYRWCNGQQDGNEQTASLFDEDKTEAINTREPEAVNMAEREEARPNEAETLSPQKKPVRINFLLDPENHEALMSLALLEQKTLTEILTAAVKSHIEANSERVKIMREAIKTARSK
ncbi:MAG: hypothetical protein IJG36_04430 [Synergistaceae bacterium]|nr:hypothetical protein [Synergistaceae bacterium]